MVDRLVCLVGKPIDADAEACRSVFGADLPYKGYRSLSGRRKFFNHRCGNILKEHHVKLVAVTFVCWI